MTDGQQTDRTRTPTWVRVLRVVVAVLAVGGIGVTWLLGGFADRRDYLSADPGQEVDAGNLVFALDDATAQQDATGKWTVIVNGSVRNDHDEALAPITGDSGNLAVSRGTGTAAAVLDHVVLGGAWQRNVVPPGEPPVGMSAFFTYPEGSTFGETIRVGIFVMEHTDNSILGVGGGELVWNSDPVARPTAMTVPLTILPRKS